MELKLIHSSPALNRTKAEGKKETSIKIGDINMV